MRGLRVSLSSGEVFWLDAELDRAKDAFRSRGLVMVGGRLVNGAQVCQVTVEAVPSIETAERLEEV